MKVISSISIFLLLAQLLYNEDLSLRLHKTDGKTNHTNTTDICCCQWLRN